MALNRNPEESLPWHFRPISTSPSAATFAPLTDIAAQMGIGPHLLERHGDDLAKIRLEAIDELADRPKGKYVVVTAITPTPLGRGQDHHDRRAWAWR